jgi:hypothetical protein
MIRKHTLLLLMGIALLGLLVACGPSGPSIRVVNSSGVDICFLYVSSSNEDNWGNDEIANTILSDGSSHVVSGLSNGNYDLKADLCDGTEIVEMGFAVDGEETWTVTR